MPSLSTTACLLLGALAPMSTACTSTNTVVMPPEAVQKGIFVVGTGEAEGKPDIARINVGIETRGTDARSAAEAAESRMSAVTSQLKVLGVADDDMKTVSYSIDFREAREPRPPQPRELERPEAGASATAAPAAKMEPVKGHYVVQNMLRITVRDLDRLGEILSKATASGANRIWGIQLEIEDDSALQAEARKRAVADAKAKAAELARLGGVELGPIVRITEGGASPPQPMGMRTQMFEAAASVPIQRGTLVVEQRVDVVFQRK